MVLFAKIVNGFQSLGIFTKTSILDVDSVLNRPYSVTAPRKTVTSNNFFPFAALNHFFYVLLVFVCMNLYLVSKSQRTFCKHLIK